MGALCLGGRSVRRGTINNQKHKKSLWRLQLLAWRSVKRVRESAACRFLQPTISGWKPPGGKRHTTNSSARANWNSGYRLGNLVRVGYRDTKEAASGNVSRGRPGRWKSYRVSGNAAHI